MQDWANLPVDLITKLLYLLKGTDCRFAFQLSQSWATVSREAAFFEIRRHVQPSTLIYNLKGFRTWRRQHGIPNLSVIFQLTQPLNSLPEVASLLASITFREVCKLLNPTVKQLSYNMLHAANCSCCQCAGTVSNQLQSRSCGLQHELR